MSTTLRIGHRRQRVIEVVEGRGADVDGRRAAAPGQQFGQSPTNRDPLGRSLYNQGGADVYGVRVPTNLVKLRADDQLPRWERDDAGDWVEVES